MTRPTKIIAVAVAAPLAITLLFYLAVCALERESNTHVKSLREIPRFGPMLPDIRLDDGANIYQYRNNRAGVCFATFRANPEQMNNLASAMNVRIEPVDPDYAQDLKNLLAQWKLPDDFAIPSNGLLYTQGNLSNRAAAKIWFSTKARKGTVYVYDAPAP